VDPALIRAVERAADSRVRRRLADHDGLVREVQVRVWRQVSSRSFLPPPLPLVALRVFGMACKGKANTAFLAELIDSDVELAETVHWAALGTRRRGDDAATLQHAVASLGALRTGYMVLGCAMRGVIYQGDPQHALDELWNGAVGTAVAASMINQIRGRSADKAFLLGLVHDVGRAALLPLVERELLELERPDAMEQVAPRVVHLLHARVGADIVRGWGLPATLVSAVAYHHERTPPDKLFNAVAVLRLANLVHQRLVSGPDQLDDDSVLLSHSLVRKLGIDRDTFAAMLALHPGALQATREIRGFD